VAEGRSSIQGQSPRAIEAPPREGLGLSQASADGLFVVTLSDYFRDGKNKTDKVLRKIAGAAGLPQVLAALGFTLPREAYFPSPLQEAHRPLKTLLVPAKLATDPPGQMDCNVRFCAPRTCWLYIRDLFARPLNLTAAESLVLRYSLQCGSNTAFIDFCQITSQASEAPGQYTPPQVLMVPPTGCLVIDIFNEDQHSEAWIGLTGFQWLVPVEEGDPVLGLRRQAAARAAGRNGR